MIARLQFGAEESGQCGAILTYPILGMPWRRNIIKSFSFDIGAATGAKLFAEVTRLRDEHPGECLPVEELWNDTSEKGNGITRDRASGTLCYSICVQRDDGSFDPEYSIKEDSGPFLASDLYRIIAELVDPYEDR